MSLEKPCDDIRRVDSLPHLNSEQFKNFIKDKKKADYIVVSKDRRQLYLLADNVVLKIYAAAFGPKYLEGPKHFEGDYKTPEGAYKIDGKNPESTFYLSLHISYPNVQDKAYAKAQGKSAGGDIMIHGFPSSPNWRKMIEEMHPRANWTVGCIAVTNNEIREIYTVIREGTTVEICKPTKP